ncbi:MAG: hypothetical protein LC734_04635 [Acidobacteria bacterium]|nr:hypothetical protein [Acidobacteriota bacterium]
MLRIILACSICFPSIQVVPLPLGGGHFYSFDTPKPFSAMSFEIWSPRGKFSKLVPISLVIRQINNTSDPVLGYKDIGFGKMPMAIYVRKSNWPERKQIGMLTPMLGRGSYSNVPVAPGSKLEAVEWLAIGLEKYFGEAGTYELQGVVANHDGTEFVHSNLISIEVTEPTANERPLYELIKESEFADYLFTGLEFDEAKLVLNRLRSSPFNTPYRRSAAFVLGRSYFSVRNFQQALPNLILLEHDNNFIFREKVRQILEKIRSMPASQTN